jgi:hypothetical protein
LSASISQSACRNDMPVQPGLKSLNRFCWNWALGAWADFFTVSRIAAEISIHRPFYPFRPGGTQQAHVLKALGLQHIDDLRRQCERKQDGRRAACALFWTLGANQVGKERLWDGAMY